MVLAKLPSKGAYYYTFKYPDKKFTVFEVAYAGVSKIRLKRIGFNPKVQMDVSYNTFVNDFRKLTKEGRGI